MAASGRAERKPSTSAWRTNVFASSTRTTPTVFVPRSMGSITV